MAVQRTTRANSIPCTFVHLMSDYSFALPEVGEFTIGNSDLNTAHLDRPYIAERHSVIKKINGQFYINDLNTTSGTFLNYRQLVGGKRTFAVLNDGDLISFGNSLEGTDCIFKFCVPPNPDQRHRSDMRKLQNASLKLSNQRKDYKKTLTVLHGKISSIKTEHTALNRDTRSQIAEFGKLINKAQLQTNIYDRKRRNEFNEQLSENYVINYKAEVFKNQIACLVESDLQCYICNEPVIKLRVSSCNHTFCEKCFTQWMAKSSVCPVCRSIVSFSTNCNSVDNFIDNYYHLVGGAAKKLRDIVVAKTTEETASTSRKEEVNATAARLLMENINGEDNDILDLTNDCC